VFSDASLCLDSGVARELVDGEPPRDAAEAGGGGDGRRLALHAYKQEWILDAAKTVFARDGITRASMREIAKTAGYTVGVLYNYFHSKEEIYAEVLQSSLGALLSALHTTAEAAEEGGQAAATIRALYTFYRERPGDFDLSFYLYQGARPVSLDHELDRRLNGLVQQVMDELAAALAADAVVPVPESRRHAVKVSSYVFGLILMAHTGRLNALGEDPDELLQLLLTDTLGHEHDQRHGSGET